MGQEILGWASSLILCATIGKQVYKQWHDDTSRGVSKWLYLGQLFSSSGFVAYSWLVGNWVFVCTNLFLLCANVTGLVIWLRHRRRARA